MESDRDAFVRSIANLWVFNRLFIGRLLHSLRESGALSETDIRLLLQRLDGDAHILGGEDDHDFVTEMLAGVRAVLAGHSPPEAGGPASG